MNLNGVQVTEEDSKILLVGATLKQVYDDLNIPNKSILSAKKSWLKLEELKKKKKPVNLNQLTNRRNIYLEMVHAKQDAKEFVSPKSKRLQEFLQYWNVDFEVSYIRKILTGPLPFKIA